QLPGDDDRLTTVQLTRSGTTQNYWFRCVPSGFPRLVVTRPGSPAPGWYLTIATSTSGASFAMILDEYGAPVWYKRLDRGGAELERRSDGRLIWVPNLGPRYGVEPDSGYRAISLYGTLLREYIAFDEGGVEHPTDHHEFTELANGRYALISYPIVDDVDLRDLPGTGWLEHDSMADNVIQEFEANGSLAWSWTLSDYFGFDEAPYPQRWNPVGSANDEVDVWHMNGLSAIPGGGGDYIVTARHLDAAFRVDRSTKQVEWILGSLPVSAPQKSGAPRLTIVDDPLDGPRRPHNAQLNGNVLTMFDNRTDTGQPSRAVAYRIDTNAKTATLIWSIEAPGAQTAFGLGSVDPDPDGSVLVGWGPVQPMIQEFDADRTLTMQIGQVPGGAIYRVAKEPKSAWTVSQLRAAAGGTAEAP
ncbi:MAG: aryl-sulfate sulfotransferase, partial [Ilumatobacteraceae bacterium]